MDTDETSADGLEVHCVTFWGAFMLDQAGSLIAGSLPHISKYGVPNLELASLDTNNLREWIPYTREVIRDGLYLRQPSHVDWVHNELSELSTIIHSALYAMYADADSPSYQDIFNYYTCMLQWYSSLPGALKLGFNSTPATIFVHIYYHFSVFFIFHPLGEISLGANTTTTTVCAEAVNAIIALMHSYQSLYGLDHMPCSLSYLLFATGVAEPEVGNGGGRVKGSSEDCLGKLVALGI